MQSLSVDIAAQVDVPNPKCKIAGSDLKNASGPTLIIFWAFIWLGEYIPSTLPDTTNEPVIVVGPVILADSTSTFNLDLSPFPIFVFTIGIGKGKELWPILISSPPIVLISTVFPSRLADWWVE